MFQTVQIWYIWYMTDLHNQYQNRILIYMYVYIEYLNILENHKHWNWDEINSVFLLCGIHDVVIIKITLEWDTIFSTT